MPWNISGRDSDFQLMGSTKGDVGKRRERKRGGEEEGVGCF